MCMASVFCAHTYLRRYTYACVRMRAPCLAAMAAFRLDPRPHAMQVKPLAGWVATYLYSHRMSAWHTPCLHDGLPARGALQAMAFGCLPAWVDDLARLLPLGEQVSVRLCVGGAGGRSSGRAS